MEEKYVIGIRKIIGGKPITSFLRILDGHKSVLGGSVIGTFHFCTKFNSIEELNDGTSYVQNHPRLMLMHNLDYSFIRDGIKYHVTVYS